VPGFVLNDTLVIQDLYWPSFALFYGLIGLISLMALFAFLWVRITQQVSGRDRGANMFKQLLVCVLLAGFLNQVLEYRPMAFFLWPLAGMLIQRGAQRG
jgi:ABC-type xylose transport system permease subunit